MFFCSAARAKDSQSAVGNLPHRHGLSLAIVGLTLGTLALAFCTAPLEADEPEVASRKEQGQDFYYRVRLSDLKCEDPLPESISTVAYMYTDPTEMFTRIILDQPGTGICLISRHTSPFAFHVHQSGDVTGTLYFLDEYDIEKGSEYALRFTLPVEGLTQQPRAYHELRADWYQLLMSQDIPGAAWFRLQHMESLALAGQDVRQETNNRFRRRSFDDTFEIFSGGRAIAENLQLDRQLQINGSDDQPYDIPLDNIKGITIQEFDWEELNQGIDPQLDLLSEYIPHDQHAIFFPSFSAMIQLVDKSDELGTPVMFTMEPRAEDAKTKDRYQTQLCLEASQLSRLLGPSIINSVAVTGSDPYLRTGSDVAILFDAKHPTTLSTYIRGKHAAALKADPTVKELSGEIEGLAYEGVASPDRTVCSFVARSGDVVLVTNSLVQVRRLAEVRSGKATKLSDLPEYAFMRNRYPLGSGDETAFLMLTDATIRRWCGPRWRIANSRRTRAAAQLAQLTAELQDQMLASDDFLDQLEPSGSLGRVLATSGGLRSPIHNTLEFMTPIAEINFTHVTKQEHNSYVRWRDGYERNWSGNFDPIAVRLSITDDKLAGDVTVMPLIGSSDFRQLAEEVDGLKLGPDSADRHDQAIVQFALGMGPGLRQLAQWVIGERASALGDTITAYIDRNDEFLAQIKDLRGINEIANVVPPLAIRAELKEEIDVEALAREFGGPPSETKTRRHGDQVIYLQEIGRTEHMEFAFLPGTPGVLVISTNEATMNAAIDRELARAAGEPIPTTKPEWIGESIGFQIDQQGWRVLDTLFYQESVRLVQERSWANLPILNEWKTRYPDRDPLEVHQEIWGTRLLCPAGGDYVWNADLQTMESTATGNPGRIKEFDFAAISPLRGFRLGNFGLTLQDDGLRARAELHIAAPDGQD